MFCHFDELLFYLRAEGGVGGDSRKTRSRCHRESRVRIFTERYVLKNLSTSLLQRLLVSKIDGNNDTDKNLLLLMVNEETTP